MMINSSQARRLSLLLSGLLLTYLALVVVALLLIWETPWGISRLQQPQVKFLRVVMVCHMATGLGVGLCHLIIRSKQGGSVRTAQGLLIAAIVAFFVSVDGLVGIVFPPVAEGTGNFLIHPVRGWTSRPNFAAKILDGIVLCDGDGLRIDEEKQIEDYSEGVPILFVGDSLTVGWGVRYKESYGVQTVAMLNRLHPEVRLKPLIGGVVGYDTRQEAHWLMEVGLPLHPRLVVLQFCLNDVFFPFDPDEVWDDRLSGDRLRPSPPVSWSGIGRAIWTWRRMPQKGTGLVTEGEKIERFGVDECLKEPESPKVAHAWASVLQSMDRCYEYCRDAGVPMVLVCYPVRLQCENPKVSTKPQRYLADWAARHHVPFLDVLAHYRKIAPKPIDAANKFLSDLTHPTPMGYEAASEALVELLEREGMVKKITGN